MIPVTAPCIQHARAAATLPRFVRPVIVLHSVSFHTRANRVRLLDTREARDDQALFRRRRCSGMTTMDGEGALAFNQEWSLIWREVRRRAALRSPSPEFPLVFRLKGGWDHGVLDQALQALAIRHSALRTVYEPTARYPPRLREMLLRLFWRHRVYMPGMYIQRTVGGPEIVIVERDAGTASIDDLVTLAMEEPLETGRLPIRAVVFHVDADTRVLVLVASHFVCDGWSMGVLVRDFPMMYRAVLMGDMADLPPIDVDYREFAHVQHRAYGSGAFAAAEAFWYQQWSELGEAAIRHAEIPFAHHVGRPWVPATASGEVRLTPAASVALRQTARRLRVTPYTLFRTALTLSLSSATGKRRIAYWANFANRHAGHEQMVGWCSNTHLVTIDMPQTGTVASLCQQIATAIRDAQGHEALPLPALWQRLGTCLDRHDTRVNFDVWPVPRHGAVPPTGPIEVVFSSFLPHLDLDVRVFDDGQCIGLRSTYDSGRYETAGVAALISVTAAIAAQIVKDPSQTPSACVRAASGCSDFATA